MKRAWASVFLVAALAAPRSALAIANYDGDVFDFELTGSARTFQLFIRQYETFGTPAETTPLTVSRVRAETRITGWDRISIEGAYDLVAVFGDQSAAVGPELAIPTTDLRYDDLHTPIDRGDTYRIDQNLDRANIALSLPEVDIRLGRQAIGHGSGRVFNPTDIFVPFSPSSLDNEYKRGVDGGTVTIPIGERAQLELIGVLTGTETEDGIYLARWQGSFPGFDISAYSGSSYRDPTFAIDIAGDAGGTGLYSEALLRLPDGSDPRLRVTLGAHHLFEFGLSVIAEAHYSSIGARHAENYLKIFASREFTHGEAFLLGQVYGALALDYELTPLIHAQTLYIQNVTDGSTLLNPAFSWDFGKNVAVNVGALLGLGKRPHVALQPMPAVIPRSEFGLYPNVYYADVRLYY